MLSSSFSAELEDINQQIPIANNPQFGLFALIFIIILLFLLVIAIRIIFLEKRHSAVINSLTDPVLCVDPDGLITYFNQSASDTFALKNQKSSKPHFLSIIKKSLHPDFQEKFTKYLFAHHRSQHRLFDRITLIKKSGEEYQANLQITATDLDHFTIIIQDINELELKFNEMQNSKILAENYNQCKNDFLASISHEIRTPMNGVIGMAGLLLQSELTQEQWNYTNIIHSSGEHLLTIINDILDFSKIENDEIHLENVPFNLIDTLEHTIAILYQQALNKDLLLLLDYDLNLDGQFHGDPTRLGQVLLNIISNAIKFSKGGNIIVRVHQVSNQNGIQNIRFSIKDSGIGIAQNKLNSIFHKFSQSGSKDEKHHMGAGLGLLISQKLVRLMQSEIQIESIIGEGSTFHFDVNFESGVGGEQISSDSEYSSLTRLRVLIVFNKHLQASLLNSQFKNLNIESHFVTSQKEALEELEKATQLSLPYNLALLEYKRSQINGFELSQEIEKHPHIQKLKTIIISDETPHKLDQKMQQSNIFSLIKRPFKLRELKDQLLQTLDNEKFDQMSKYHYKNTLIFDSQNEILIVDDDEVNLILVVQLLKNYGFKHVDIATNGERAIQLHKKNSYDMILMDCHMPVMDGFKATKVIRSLQSGSHNVPIVAMTANVTKVDKDKCFDSGMNEFLSKPIKKETFEQILQSFFTPIDMKVQNIQGISVVKRFLNNLPSFISSSIIENLLLRIGHDQDLSVVQSLFQIFFEETEEQIDQLSYAIETNNLIMIGEYGQKLKEAGGNLGLTAICEIGDYFEYFNADLPSENINQSFTNVKFEVQKIKIWYQTFLEHLES